MMQWSLVCYIIGEGCFHENGIKFYLEIYQGVDDDFDNVDLDCWQHLPRWLVMAQSQDFWGGRLWGNSFCVWLFCVWFCDNDSVFVFSRFWFGVWVLSYLVIGFFFVGVVMYIWSICTFSNFLSMSQSYFNFKSKILVITFVVGWGISFLWVIFSLSPQPG